MLETPRYRKRDCGEITALGDLITNTVFASYCEYRLVLPTHATHYSGNILRIEALNMIVETHRDTVLTRVIDPDH